MDKFETLEDYQNSLKEFNERTRKSYENFIQEHGDDSQKLQLRCTPYTEKKGRYGVASLDFGFQIWQSRQAEVDLINATHDGQMIGHDIFVKQLKERHEKQVQGLAKAISKFETEMDALQSKIDAVGHILGCAMIAPKEVFQYADRIGRALRGERD